MSNRVNRRSPGNRNGLVTVASLAALAGCGGPSVQFDPAPAPGWIRDKPSDVAAATLTAVGAAPATLDAKRDEDMAVRNAKTQLAQLFESQVAARTSDWSMASAGGSADSERQVTSQSVEVRSNVKVEDVALEASYRDEATRTHYAHITVDRKAWTARLERRLNDGLAEVDSHLQAARSAAASGKALGALAELISGYAKGRDIEPDIVVVDLLASDLGIRNKLLELKRQLDDVGQKLRGEHKFAVLSRGPKTAGSRLAKDLQQFLASYGFSVAAAKGGAGAIRVQAQIGQRFVTTETVAGRAEHVHAAQGVLRVIDADGNEVPSLTINLAEDRHQERDVNKKAAEDKAIVLATDTLASRFRSAFRKAFPIEQLGGK